MRERRAAEVSATGRGDGTVPGRDGPRYVERWRVPVSWWLFTLAMVASLWLAYAVAVPAWWVHVGGGVLAALAAGGLAVLGRTRVTVDEHGLWAGNGLLPWSAIGPTTALSAGQARLLRGPGADARARLLVRPYLQRAVCVECVGVGEPYWYVATRHPDRLAAALRPGAEAQVPGAGSGTGS